jgi:hypothetical protein
MKKNFLWMLATILICGLTVTTMTSCSDDDDDSKEQGQTTPETIETLTGDWFTTINRSDETDEENDVEYVLLTFDENGVITQNIYVGNTTESLKYWERMRRHGIYSVDKAAQTISTINLTSEPETLKYSFDKQQLILSYANAEASAQTLKLTFHRPTQLEKEILAIYDRSLWGDDYVGKWFSVNEHNGLNTYVMNEFTDSRVNTIRYSVYEGKCTRTTSSQYCFYIDEDDDENYFDMPMLEIHDANDYSNTFCYWWKIKDNNLLLGLEEEDDPISVFHPLTQADIDLMADLDKMATK